MRSLVRSISSITALLILSVMESSAETPLSLESYLAQVASRDSGVAAAELTSQAGVLQAAEGRLLVMPSFFLEASHGIDKKRSAFFPATSTTLDTVTFGFVENTPWGTSAKLSYFFDHYNYEGLAPGFGPNPPKFYEGRPQIEVSQSFWRNGFGGEIRAQKRASEARALSSHFFERFKRKRILSVAESVYWRLALARDSLAIQRKTMERAQMIFDWSSRRARLGLSDQADALQADAGKATRELDLQLAVDQERAARLAFNDLRRVAGDAVPETLDPLDRKLFDSLTIPPRAENRDDVLAAQHMETLQTATMDLARHRNLPKFDIYGVYAANSWEAQRSDAVANSFEFDRPSWQVGFKFSTPLDFWAQTDALKGFRLERQAAGSVLDRTRMDQETEWTNLTTQFREAQNRFLITKRIEASQLKKLEYEQGRLKRGRTTTYQILLFEQDYSLAALTRLRTEAEILDLIARMRLFSDGGAS